MPSSLDFSLYLITSQKVLPHGQTLPQAIREALAGGVQAVQLREKELTPRVLLPLAMEIRRITREYGARLLINDRADLAMACDADGVHLTTTSLPTAAARKTLGPDKLIGVSTHSLEEIARAQSEGADFVTFGPVFHTPSKAAYGPPAGLAKLREACSSTRLPVFALGGIHLHQTEKVMACGASGIALISAILASSDPQGQASRFVRHLSEK